MSAAPILGIDPGLCGGLAVVGKGFQYAWKMPETERDLLDTLEDVKAFGVTTAFLEFVRSSPQMGVVSAFKFGSGYGGLRMAVLASGLRLEEVTPQKWQKALQCRTAAAYAKAHPGKPFAALVHGSGEWARFPWEMHEAAGPEDAVVRMLQFIGEDPHREGLVDTPARVVRSWAELFGGYKQNPADILARRFQQFGDYNEMVVLRNIPFSSMCEHHILPFYGTATVGYIPQGAVIGISKIARLVRCFARRLQVQERMTAQIGDALADAMAPLGVGVVIKATHLCMTARGVMVHDTEMVTTKLIGNFMDAAIRAEFLDAAR